MSHTILERTSDAEWFEQRRQHVTATDVARLAHGGPATWAAVKAEKRTGQRAFVGNRFTEWGKEREPVIAEYVQFAHDVAPNDRVFVLDGTQWSATPDGATGKRGGEYKTTNRPWEIWKPADLRDVKPVYYDQVQWAQLVGEFEDTAFAWEVHENFVPVEMKSIIIPRDEERINELVEVALRFVDFLAEDEQPSEFGDLIAAYAERKAEVLAAQEALAQVEKQIRDRAGDRDVSEVTPYGKLSYTWPKPRETFDAARFKKEHKELAAEYVKTTAPKAQTLRITL